MPKFADLHCHTSGKNYYKYSVGKHDAFHSPQAHLWNLPFNKYKKRRKGHRGTHYSQSDIGRCVESGTQLVFTSLYPFEQGFFMRKHKRKPDTIQKFPPFLLKTAMQYTHQRISYVQNSGEENGDIDAYNYFTELNRELEFILRKSGQRESGTIRYYKKVEGEKRKEQRRLRRLNRRGQKEVSGTYWVIAPNPERWERDRTVFGESRLKKTSDIDDILDTDTEVAVVLTIEGMHALSMTDGYTTVSEEELMRRIDLVKEWPVFFITFAHHFNNNLCAHAKSMFKLRRLLGIWDFNPDQDLNCDHIGDETGQGFTDLGIRALERLLSIRVTMDDDRQVTGVQDPPEAGRRVLVDVKHMSVVARRKLYVILGAFNQGKALADRIPIVASHVAYSGIATIEELIDLILKSRETSDKKDPNFKQFNPWNINLCDEDVQHIVLSSGLIGLNLDQRILGIVHKVSLWRTILGLERRESKRARAIDLIVRNLLRMADAVREQGLHRYRGGEHSFWHCICLGSDFDGGIDPVNAYSTLSAYPDLYKDLVNAFHDGEGHWQMTDYGITPANAEEVAQLLCLGNAKRLVEVHFG